MAGLYPHHALLHIPSPRVAVTAFGTGFETVVNVRRMLNRFEVGVNQVHNPYILRKSRRRRPPLKVRHLPPNATCGSSRRALNTSPPTGATADHLRNILDVVLLSVIQYVGSFTVHPMRRSSIVMVLASVVIGVLVRSMGARSESSLVGTVYAHASLEGYEDGPTLALVANLLRIRRRRLRATGVCFERVVNMGEADVEDVWKQPMG
ncbi:hypothetical protein OF83DRAFT_1088648 [Amylostereum chailletii]|nr:hypothetical protein OF83DRAFT_1088648 [Amylostereum chailletii]